MHLLMDKKMTEKFYDKFLKKNFDNSADSEKKFAEQKSQKNHKNLQSKKQSFKTSLNKNSFNFKNQNSKNQQIKNQQKKSAEKISSLFDDAKIPEDAKKIINNFDLLVKKTHPLNSKQQQILPKQIRELSHNLTDERGERRLGYMNSPTTLSAYVHYFSWWNLVRLTKLFANLPSSYFELADNSICLDIGSGPLTVPISLFLSRPELRKKKLMFYCLDISQQSLSFGENIFLSLAAELQEEPWKVIRVKGEFGTPIKDKADFITSANFFNELNDENGTPPDFIAKKLTEKILSYTNMQNSKAKILIVEPGVPKSARLVSLMRDSLARKNFIAISPCTHFEKCNMNGEKGEKWCNFCFNTQNAPKNLKKLSELSELPKERAVLSFIATQKMSTDEIEKTELADEKFLTFRITSEEIYLPNHKVAYYACSKLGLLLVLSETKLFSGESFKVKMPSPHLLQRRDKKTDAILVDLCARS